MKRERKSNKEANRILVLVVLVLVKVLLFFVLVLLVLVLVFGWRRLLAEGSGGLEDLLRRGHGLPWGPHPVLLRGVVKLPLLEAGLLHQLVVALMELMSWVSNKDLRRLKRAILQFGVLSEFVFCEQTNLVLNEQLEQILARLIVSIIEVLENTVEKLVVILGGEL